MHRLLPAAGAVARLPARPHALLLPLALALAACSPADKAPAAASAPPPVEVAVVTVQPAAVAVTTELAGRTSAYQVAEVRPQVGGILKERLFREGTAVKAGAPLYRIDPASYDAEVERAQAALAKAEANVATARIKADRYTELAKINFVSADARDDLIAALKQAEADEAAARAALQTARINRGYTTVTAPIGGLIGRSALTPGALVTANQATALATIQQLDPIYVDVTQSSADLLRLRRDLASGRLKSAGADQARVKLLLEDGSAYPLEGRLQFSEVSVDPATGSVTLRAVFPNPNQQLLPGMYVRAVLEEGVVDNAILVPQQAVSRDPRGNALALVVAADGTVQQRALRTTRALGDKWLVTEGLAAGDRVIVEGLQRVRPGAPVRAVEKATAAAPAAANAPDPAQAGAAPAKADAPKGEAAKASAGN
jgi:membrane fusion protein (multidrug efflux system)